jgi:hypothetical protein
MHEVGLLIFKLRIEVKKLDLGWDCERPSNAHLNAGPNKIILGIFRYEIIDRNQFDRKLQNARSRLNQDYSFATSNSSQMQTNPTKAMLYSSLVFKEYGQFHNSKVVDDTECAALRVKIQGRPMCPLPPEPKIRPGSAD